MSTSGSGGYGGDHGSGGSGGRDKGKMPATGHGGGRGPPRRPPTDVPRNFYNPANSRSVPEEDLPPSSQANDYRDTREYMHSTNCTGPEDKDRRDECQQADSGWDADGYYWNKNYKTGGKKKPL